MNYLIKLCTTDLFAFGAVQLPSAVHKAHSARTSRLFPQRESPFGDLSDADNVQDMAPPHPPTTTVISAPYWVLLSVSCGLEQLRSETPACCEAPQSLLTDDVPAAWTAGSPPFMFAFVPPPLFLNEPPANPAADPGQSPGAVSVVISLSRSVD